MNYPHGINYSSPYPSVAGICPFSSFSGSINSFGSSTDKVNILRILPFSINDDDDYINGVTTLDLVHIQRHILEIANLNTLIPVADSLYRKISADADGDWEITYDDIDMIQDLILGRRTDFNRTSWEWVSENEITENSALFQSNPYSFVINDRWPGGILFPGLSEDDIENALPSYFEFRTTKIGDVVGGGSSDSNTWICGSGTYFNDSEWSNRSDSSPSMQRITKGNKVIVRINIEGKEPLSSVELPIKISNEDFEVVHVNQKSTTALWHYNPDHERLMVVDFDRNAKALSFKKGKYLEVILKAKRDIERPDEAVHWCEKRNIEVINTDLKPANVNVDLEMNLIEANDTGMNWNSGSKTIELYQLTQGKNELSIYTISGQLVFNKNIPYIPDGYDLNLDFLKGSNIYLVTLVNESGVHTQKVFVN